MLIRDLGRMAVAIVIMLGLVTNQIRAVRRRHFVGMGFVMAVKLVVLVLVIAAAVQHQGEAVIRAVEVLVVIEIRMVRVQQITPVAIEHAVEVLA